MNEKLRALLEKRANVHKQAEDLLALAAITAEQREQVKKLQAEYKELSAEIELRQAQDSNGSQLEAGVGRVVGGRAVATEAREAPSDPKKKRTIRVPHSMRASAEQREYLADAYDALEERGRMSDEVREAVSADPLERQQQELGAVRDWMRHGANQSDESRLILSPYSQRSGREARAQSVGTDAAGGYAVPEGFMAKLFEALKSFGAMFQVATILRTETGNDLPIPTENDTANEGVILAENAEETNDQDIVFAQILLKAYKYSSKRIKASSEFLEDVFFPIDNWLLGKLATRISRIVNKHATTGTGTGQPKGIVVASTQGRVGPTGQTLTVKYLDFVKLLASVDPAYQGQSRFMMNMGSYGESIGIVDAQGRPIFQLNPTVSPFGTILGKEIVINTAMADMAANAKSILYGDFSLYLLRQVGEMRLRRLVERYAEFDQVAFLGFARFDGNLIDAGTNPVKHYANSAT